ncbi:hypothetical protein [Bradyrhizobium manausense]|uniref:Uncharacterized protein n=1 Tax=Bradyrhizobium manausense TaxID=989370 RepID=A0A0R3DP41_9BRAD|nr:hypothetical protein [Bradyrhizobium manausense]KRQ10174.1 hypothetical protein AOQ71_19595 [Bradyrhizobium manausense]
MLAENSTIAAPTVTALGWHPTAKLASWRQVRRLVHGDRRLAIADKDVQFEKDYDQVSSERCEARKARRGVVPNPAYLEYRREYRETRKRFFELEPSPERFTATVSQRLESGYHCENIRFGGKSTNNGNVFQKLVHEVELRSKRHFLLKRIVAGTAKVRGLSEYGIRQRAIARLVKLGIPLSVAASGLYDWGWARARKLISELAENEKLTLDARSKFCGRIQRALRQEVKSRFEADADHAAAINRLMKRIANQVVHRYGRADDMSSGELRSGPFNDVRFGHDRKLFALDGQYINLRTDCAEIFRLERDDDFPSLDCLRDFLDTLRVRPQIVVWFWDSRYPERVIRPHFYYILQEKCGVWYGEAKATRMLHAVAAALNKDLKGDPGGLANIFDGKNPLSPHSDYLIGEENLKTLSQLCEILEIDLDEDLDRGMRYQCIQSMVQAGIDEKASMFIYNWAWNRSRGLLKSWQQIGSIQVNAWLDHAALIERVYGTMSKELCRQWTPRNAREREKAERALRCQARTAVERLGKRSNNRGWNVGAAQAASKTAVEALSDQATRQDKVKAAQKAGQAHRSRVVVERNIALIRDHIAHARSAGKKPTVASIAVSTGLHEKTVKKHWKTAASDAESKSVRLAFLAAMFFSSAAEIRSPVRGIEVEMANKMKGGITVWGARRRAVDAHISDQTDQRIKMESPARRVRPFEKWVRFVQAGQMRIHLLTGRRIVLDPFAVIGSTHHTKGPIVLSDRLDKVSTNHSTPSSEFG